MYRCRLVRRTPYACSPALDGSVLIVAVKECIFAFGSVIAPSPIFWVGAPSLLCCCLGAEWANISCVCADLEAFVLLAPILGITVEWVALYVSSKNSSHLRWCSRLVQHILQ